MIWSCQTGNKKAWDFSWSAVRKLHWKPTWKLELVASLKHWKTIAKSQNCWDSIFDYWRESHFYGLSISIISHLQTNGQLTYVYIYIIYIYTYNGTYIAWLRIQMYTVYTVYLSFSSETRATWKIPWFIIISPMKLAKAGGIPHFLTHFWMIYNWIRSEWFSSSHLPRGLHFGFLFFRRCHFLFPHVLWLCALSTWNSNGWSSSSPFLRQKKKVILPFFGQKVMHHILLSWIVDRLRRSANSPEKRGTPHGPAENPCPLGTDLNHTVLLIDKTNCGLENVTLSLYILHNCHWLIY